MQPNAGVVTPGVTEFRWSGIFKELRLDDLGVEPTYRHPYRSPWQQTVA